MATGSRRARKIVLGVLLLAALVLGGLGVARWRRPSPIQYTTAPVTRGQVISVVTASGTLRPVVQVQVGSQVSGRIKDLLVDYNDHVTKGEVLARLDPAVFESQVAQARSRLVAARADRERTQAVADA